MVTLAGLIITEWKSSINPLMTYCFTHHYHLGESIFIFSPELRVIFIFYLIFSIIFINIQNRLRWDARTSGAIGLLFAYIP